MNRKEPWINNIIKEEENEMLYFEYFSNGTLSTKLNKGKYRLPSDEVSSRNLNHWESKGLLSTVRPNGKGWRKHSLIDLVWIQIISELRQFGVSTERIFAVKQCLSEFGDEASAFPELEFYIVLALSKRPTFLAVFKNGEAHCCSLKEYYFSKRNRSVGNDLLISLNEILQRLFPTKDFIADQKHSSFFNDDEVELLTELRFTDWQEIKIKGKDGKIELIERIQYIEKGNKIRDIIGLDDYQNLELKIEKGKVKSLKRTVKKKM